MNRNKSKVTVIWRRSLVLAVGKKDGRRYERYEEL